MAPFNIFPIDPFGLRTSDAAGSSIFPTAPSVSEQNFADKMTELIEAQNARISARRNALPEPALTAFSEPFDFEDVSRKTVRGNIDAAGRSGAAASTIALRTAQQLDPFLADRFFANLDEVFPQHREVFGKMTANTQDLLRGEVPEDVADMIRMFSAEQGVSGALASTARNLGLTSLDLSTQGFGQGADLFEIANRFLTPPTTDVEAAATDIRRQLIGAGLSTPAQVSEISLRDRDQNLRAQSLLFDQQRFNANYALSREQLGESMRQFDEQMAWDRELSAMNQEFEQFQIGVQRELFSKALQARAAEQAAAGKAFEDITSVIAGGSKQPNLTPSNNANAVVGGVSGIESFLNSGAPLNVPSGSTLVGVGRGIGIV